jgi:hypothetical protein
MTSDVVEPGERAVALTSRQASSCVGVRRGIGFFGMKQPVAELLEDETWFFWWD